MDWEEKRKLKYKTSELRLVEVIEAACSKEGFQCNKILEEYEEDIEHWYYKLLVRVLIIKLLHLHYISPVNQEY